MEAIDLLMFAPPLHSTVISPTMSYAFFDGLRPQAPTVRAQEQQLAG